MNLSLFILLSTYLSFYLFCTFTQQFYFILSISVFDPPLTVLIHED